MLGRFSSRVAVAVLEGDDKVPYWSGAVGDAASALRGSGGSPAAATAIETAARVAASSAGVRLSIQIDPVAYPHIASAYELEQPWQAPEQVQDALGPPGAEEATMAAQLRGVGAWTNVDAHFPEFPMYALNHLRVSVSRAFVRRVGQDVPRFVFAHAWRP